MAHEQLNFSLNKVLLKQDILSSNPILYEPLDVPRFNLSKRLQGKRSKWSQDHRTEVSKLKRPDDQNVVFKSNIVLYLS